MRTKCYSYQFRLGRQRTLGEVDRLVGGLNQCVYVYAFVVYR